MGLEVVLQVAACEPVERQVDTVTQLLADITYVRGLGGEVSGGDVQLVSELVVHQDGN
jgi:hypothetical protein